jgi:hypothetical protein
MTRKKTEQEQAKEFALVLPVVLGVLAMVFWWGPWFLPQKKSLSLPLLIAGPSVCLVAVLVPPLWLRFFRVWMKFAEGLGWVMTRVILSVFYFLILTPVGVVMRIFGRRPLDLGWKDGKATYWIDKKPGEYTVERYQRLF